MDFELKRLDTEACGYFSRADPTRAHHSVGQERGYYGVGDYKHGMMVQ